MEQFYHQVAGNSRTFIGLCGFDQDTLICRSEMNGNHTFKSFSMFTKHHALLPMTVNGEVMTPGKNNELKNDD